MFKVTVTILYYYCTWPGDVFVLQTRSPRTHTCRPYCRAGFSPPTLAARRRSLLVGTGRPSLPAVVAPNDGRGKNTRKTNIIRFYGRMRFRNGIRLLKKKKKKNFCVINREMHNIIVRVRESGLSIAVCCTAWRIVCSKIFHVKLSMSPCVYCSRSLKFKLNKNKKKTH